MLEAEDGVPLPLDDDAPQPPPLPQGAAAGAGGDERPQAVVLGIAVEAPQPLKAEGAGVNAVDVKLYPDVDGVAVVAVPNENPPEDVVVDFDAARWDCILRCF